MEQLLGLRRIEGERILMPESGAEAAQFGTPRLRPEGAGFPGGTPVAGVHHPISIVRMAVDDAYGLVAEGSPGVLAVSASGSPAEVRSACESACRTRAALVMSFST